MKGAVWVRVFRCGFSLRLYSRPNRIRFRKSNLREFERMGGHLDLANLCGLPFHAMEFSMQLYLDLLSVWEKFVAPLVYVSLSRRRLNLVGREQGKGRHFFLIFFKSHPKLG